MTLSKEDPERTASLSFQEIQEGGLPSRLTRFDSKGSPSFHFPLESLCTQIYRLVLNAPIFDKMIREIPERGP